MGSGGLALATHAAYGGATFALNRAYGGFAVAKMFAQRAIVVGNAVLDPSAFDVRNAWPFELWKHTQKYGFWIFGICLAAAVSALWVLKKAELN
jgi:hypothetical protein